MDKSEQSGLAALRAAAQRGALGAAVILSGGGDLSAAAQFVAAAVQCRQEGAAPCGDCPACRKVRAGIHPDVITVTDAEHKQISVDVLRQVRSDAYILPNEGRRKVYIFPDSSLLSAAGQNVLLKVLEEGPGHAMFLFCAANSAALLPTIRSRCTLWRLGEGEAAPGEGAEALCRLLLQRDRLALAAYFTSLEVGKCKREELLSLLSQSRELTARALLAAAGCPTESAVSREMARRLSKQQLSAMEQRLETAVRQLRFNLNIGHITGALSVELAELM